MSGAIGVAQLEAKQAKMTAEQTRLIFREADHHADRHADKAALDTLPVPAGAVSVVINQKSSVYEGVTARCATERIKRNSVSSRSSTSNAALGAAALPTHPTQTAWLANASSRSARQCAGLQSASMGGVLEAHAHELRQLFAFYAAADTSAAEARKATRTMNIVECHALCEAAGLYEDRLLNTRATLRLSMQGAIRKPQWHPSTALPPLPRAPSWRARYYYATRISACAASFAASSRRSRHRPVHADRPLVNETL